jgi:TrmH family RNA methyltransferase
MLTNADIKLFKSLDKKKYRNQNGLFVIEGIRLIQDAVLSNWKIKSIYITDVFLNKKGNEDTVKLVSKNSIPFNTITEKEMKSIANTVTPSGILALCEIPQSLILDVSITDNWLYLDKIQDPGNIGTILRSSAWFGIHNVALSEDCIDPYNPKVLRSGMGAHFNLNIHNDVSLKNFKKHLKIGAFQEGESIYEHNTPSVNPWILVIGSEAHGISDNNIKLIDKKVTIPKLGTGESLNAAMASSILLYHLTVPLLSEQ